jgi:hypothetical protein
LKLFHGSNVKIENPKIDFSRNSLDFGRSFYVTSSMEQARNWAKRKSQRLGQGIPVVNVYKFVGDFSVLKIKKFEAPNEEWLDFVISNRNENYHGETFDIVVGPVADDSVIRTIRLYVNGIYDKEEALKRFKTEVLDDQFLFATENALEYLKFEEAIIV